MCIVVTGGGTGGHLIIAKVIACELKNRGVKTIFIGSSNGQDKSWFENSDIFHEKYFLKSSGVVNKKGFKKIFSLFNIITQIFEVRKILKNKNIKAVFSVGGYSAAPASFWAVLFKIPLFIHEQNAFTGKLNKLLKPFSKAFYSSYEKPNFNYPINLEFFKASRIRKNLKTILFMGGSQGASFINSLALNLANDLHSKNIKIIHQCGKKEFDKIKAFYDENKIDALVVDFSNDMPNLMNKADLCISRSGASSLWELCANNLPAIFIPFPYAANDHQFYNAKFLGNNTKIIRQDRVLKEEILTEIFNYDLEKTSLNLKELTKENGCKEIVDDMIKKIKK
ncbi:undecaprenyldiphospho-muramoylpentapeptide beta-N-acetylglucosaminyltransferase [Campylobacter ureolyticus ACS-301-V-Sch3b]|uniref:UDP-N-acetylglucosamine--N-acetylmuramyl-(pentapeptide) pyrophosphoryl-undecaprenol N-acetylglucosamine transferase n=1 Tax=Campylobacter ureolyticus ACS-301-V-Sch3b TaxID=883165 RepID=S3XCI8_9BACT|nr:undecaprenyldiphospho-muramoylpentapeptide beta-N-acetylglucosaminyltransferase [Campylobacter ureolyticus]EPH07841.1 undecaprenyldiphospho-muramoylpentapeptide beta-N-acetylglucosaminyltransferase [Campylobacter ureolyticus ACS-301-V-Sch3b]